MTIRAALALGVVAATAVAIAWVRPLRRLYREAIDAHDSDRK